MKSLWGRVRADTSGATMLEYGIMVLMIAIVSVAIITVIGQVVVNFFSLGNAL